MESGRKSEKSNAESGSIAGGFNIEDVFRRYTERFGRFQRLLFLYIVLFIAPLMSFNTTTQFLMFLVPPHTCPAHPNIINESAHNFTSFSDSNSQKITFNLSFFYSTVVSEVSCLTSGSTELLIFPSHSAFPSQNEWVCDNEWKAMLPHTFYRLGSFGGILIVGTIADR